MASNITANEYDATIRMAGFAGLYQDGDGTGDPRYAVEAVNVLTKGDVLQSVARSAQLPAALPGPIGTLARLYRRWHAAAAQREVLIAASGGLLYWLLPAAPDAPDGKSWTQVKMPSGTAKFQSDTWSWAAYEINEAGSDAPVDVLLLSNAQDGMIMVRGDTMVCTRVPTPKKFGIIARSNERIWGAAIPDDPDMLMYSAPFDPTDWSVNAQIPEDGAGDILQPSWDGDSFTALTQFGSQLLAFKRNRIWRILNTDPGEYVFREQHGGGTAYARTVQVAGEIVLMLGNDGVTAYDGLTVEAYYPQYAREVYRRMNRAALSGARACLYKDVYYLALPLGESTVNNAILLCDLQEHTWLLREEIPVMDFLPTDNALYYTSAVAPGRVYRWGEDGATGTSGATGATGALPARWISPWMDLGRKDVRFGGFTVYLAVDAEQPVTVQVTIRTERKAKTKTYRSAPTGAGNGPKIKRLAIGGIGHRFRLELQIDGTSPWRLFGGVQLRAELEPE